VTISLFAHADASSLDEALGALSATCWPVGGGTDLLGLMREELAAPERLVSLKTIEGLDRIEAQDSGWDVGATVRLSDLAAFPAVSEREDLACLREAVWQTASPQLRHMATIGGNLLQRPRCWYFRNKLTHCWLKGGPRCFAVRGENKYHAILGRGGCQAVHPSDPAVALVALDGTLTVVGPDATRMLGLSELFQQPQRDARSQTTLRPFELITHILIPRPEPGTRSTYVKIAERTTWDFALVAAAVKLAMANGVVRSARVVLGGVGPMPWRAPDAEQVLVGDRLDPDVIDQAAQAATAGARPLAQNEYKLALAQGAVRQALRNLCQ
jgi:xanthine dehydrogenase YagS FAD-binding subunit